MYRVCLFVLLALFASAICACSGPMEPEPEPEPQPGPLKGWAGSYTGSGTLVKTSWTRDSFPEERKVDTIKVAKPVTLGIKPTTTQWGTASWAFVEFGFVGESLRARFSGPAYYSDSTFSVTNLGPSNTDKCYLKRATSKEATGRIVFLFRRTGFQLHFDDTTYVYLTKVVE